MSIPPLLVIWHSRTGTAEALASAAVRAAGARGSLVAAAEASAADLLAARGYLFVCPENLGTMSGAMKEFFDAAYYPLLGRIEGQAYASIVAAGSDGTGAQRQLDRICAGWRLKRVAAGVIVNTGAQTPQAIAATKTVAPSALVEAEDLGRAMSEGLEAGIF